MKLKYRIKHYLVNSLELFLKNKAFIVNKGLIKGIKIKGTRGFYYSKYIFFLNKEESAEELFFQELPLKNKIVYDIGAHIGVFTMFFSKKVGRNGKVISFEPNKNSFKTLKEHIKINRKELYNNIKIFNKGIGNKTETRKLKFSQHFSATGSIVKTIQNNLAKRHPNLKEMDVKIDSLDNIIKNYKIPAPDFIKIDVEGMEYFVLKGMISTIIKNKKPYLYIEVHNVNGEEKLKNIKRIFDLLQKYNYKIFHIESKEYLTHKNYEIGSSGHLYCI